MKAVVIGASFSGALMSWRLSQAGVEHILIGGDEPDSTPRLGESLNECASPDLFAEFGRDFPDCFQTKSHISLLAGDFATMVIVGSPRRDPRTVAARLPHPADPKVRPSRTLWASLSGRNLMHADRIRLDQEVYRKAIARPECEFVKDLIETVEIDADDRVSRIVLKSSREIDAPNYVFDTTGFRGIVARAAKVGIRATSNEQRVVWTHLERSPDERPQRWWLEGTNLLKLVHDIDGIDGIAWMIPINTTLSVGISVDADRYGDVDGEAVIALLNDAYARRGVDYPDIFRERIRPIVELRHRYYVRDRAFGANWLLVGGSYISIWFPSSSGLWTTVAAARLATQLMAEPQKYGVRYQEMMDRLLGFHEVLDGMIHGAPFASKREAYRFWTRWISGVPIRLSDYLAMVRADGSKTRLLAILRWWGNAARRRPVFGMITYSFFLLRVVWQPTLGRQGRAFVGYFRRRPFFLASSYLRGQLHWLVSGRSRKAGELPAAER